MPETSVLMAESACRNCRCQRLRCDATKPRCRKCASRKTECRGYGPTPVRWLQPQLGTEQVSRVATRGRPRLVYMSEPDNDVSVPPMRWYQRHGQLASMSHDGDSALVRELRPAGYDSARLILSSLSYLNQEIMCHLVRTDGPTLSLELPLEYWCYYPDMVLDLLVPTTLMHQLVRCRWPGHDLSQGTSTALRRRLDTTAAGHPHLHALLEHKQASLSALRREITEPETRYGDIVLTTIIILMGLELQQSAIGPWSAHLKATRAIIAHRGGLSSLVQANPDLVFNLSRYMVTDIIRLTTTPSHKLDTTAADQLEYLDFVTDHFHDGLSVGFPCTDTLLGSLVEINHARFLLCYSSPTGQDAEQLSQRLFQQIISFEPAPWARNVVERFLLQKEWALANHAPAADAGKETSRSRVLAVETTWTSLVQSWEAAAMAFKAAVLLYYLRVLVPSSSASMLDAQLNISSTATGGGLLDLIQARKAAVLVLLKSIPEAWSFKDTLNMWSGRFLIWPLLVAGLEMDSFAELECQKSMVCESLRGLCPETGSLAPLDAVETLEMVWETSGQARAAGVDTGSWLDIVSALDVEGVFY